MSDDLVKMLRALSGAARDPTITEDPLDHAADHIEALTAERDRLREVLEAIVDEYNGQVHGPIIYSIDDARAALKGETP